MEVTKFGVLGDIHANLEALESVLADAKKQGVGAFVSVGDLVGYNANPGECVNLIREMNCVVVRGNHDHYCSHDECLDDFHPLAAEVVDWTRRQLTVDQVDFLKGLRMRASVRGFTLVHSTLDMPEKWGYVFDVLEAEASFNYQTTTVCFHGHTHVPAIYDRVGGRVNRLTVPFARVALGKKLFVNTGSVGQPRDGDPRASYAIFDMKLGNVELRRVQYNIEKAQEKIRAAGLPERLARRLASGK